MQLYASPIVIEIVLISHSPYTQALHCQCQNSTIFACFNINALFSETLITEGRSLYFWHLWCWSPAGVDHAWDIYPCPYTDHFPYSYEKLWVIKHKNTILLVWPLFFTTLYKPLRVRTVGRQNKIFHVYYNFYSGFMCQTTVIFGITKDRSHVLNTLESWNCFTCRNLFQNDANDMSECLTRETAFCKKAQNFV